MLSKGFLRVKAFASAAICGLLLSACGPDQSALSKIPDNSAAVAGTGLPPVTKKPESVGLAAGSILIVQLLEVLDSSNGAPPPFIVAKIPEDVMGADGKLAFQAGSPALLQVRSSGRQKDTSSLDLALYSITSGGQQVRFVNGGKDLATASYTEDATLGAAHRTVHLGMDTRIPFKLQAPVSLK